MTILDETHRPALTSWIESANDAETDFSIQNLPYGVFSTKANPSPRVGVAIGVEILDLNMLQAHGLLDGPEGIFAQNSLNAFMALGRGAWSQTRKTLSTLLLAETATLRDDEDLKALALIVQQDATLHLPFNVQGYTDFYASREHATNVGSMFRDPENALMPNWLHIPIGYNGRASTVVVSGTDIHRPLGQIRLPDTDGPIFSACRKLDIELEMGAVVGMPSVMGQPVSVEAADDMIFGFVLLNDWSARDIQVWEYQPLGPFQSKAFATTISPWVVTQEALAPFRTAGPEQSPAPLPYLSQHGLNNYDLTLQVAIRPAGAIRDTTISETNFKYMYWSSAQQLAHHAISGCAMRTGDLLGSGTISGSDKGSYGSLLEMTWNGRDPISLDDGLERTFIQDGDTLTLKGWCQGDGYRVGFGVAKGTILPATDFGGA